MIMATTDATRCYTVGDDLTTPANQARPAAVEVLQSDLSRILSHHRHRNTGNRRNRKVFRKQLNGVPSDRRDEIGTLRQAFADDPTNDSRKRGYRIETAQPRRAGIWSYGWNYCRNATG